MIPEHQKQNLETICKAAQNGDLGLAECTRRDDGSSRILLVAKYTDDVGAVVMVPMAVLFNDNPYETYFPPGQKEDICGTCGSNKCEFTPAVGSGMCEECGAVIKS